MRDFPVTDVICAVAALLFWILHPETKEKTLTELCQMFVKKKQIEVMKEDTLPFQPIPLQKV